MPAKRAAAWPMRSGRGFLDPPHERLGERRSPSRDLVEVAARERVMPRVEARGARSTVRMLMSAGSSSLMLRRSMLRRRRLASRDAPPAASA